MRKWLVSTVLLSIVLISAGACSRPVSDIDKMQTGTAVTVTMKDGSAISGRLVEVKPDAVVVDPADGGEWRTVSRDQIASVNATTATNAAQQPPAEQAPAGGNQPRGTQSNGRTSSASHRSAATHAPAAGSREPAPAGREVVIPANTVLHARLDTNVGSDTSRPEDPIQASITKPILVDGFEAIPAGSTLTGVVTDARPSGKVRGRAAIAFRFNSISVPGGQRIAVRTHTIEMEAEATKKKDALKIGVPAAGGAILGGILGGKKGALIGGAAGGGAGTAMVLTSSGKELRLTPGTAMTVKLLEPVTVEVTGNR